MGAGWSWSRKAGTENDHAAAAAEGWQEIKRRLATEQHALRAGRIHLSHQLGMGRLEDVHRHLVTEIRLPTRDHHRSPRRSQVDRAGQLVTEMTKIKHPFDDGQKGQRGIEW